MIKPLLLITLLFMSACSTLNPYEENFVCTNKDNHGKCLDVHGAYNEAVSETDIAPHFDQNGKFHQPHASSTKSYAQGQSTTTANGFNGYKDQEYQRLHSLLDEPVAPVVRPALTIRTLILPYRSETTKKEYLYMPRYVFSILEQPSFIMGDYLLDDSQNLYTTE